jgi:thioredoxin-like negative regulator of GroEL
MGDAITISGESFAPMRDPSNEEWIARTTQLQETLAACPADLSARSELAMLLEQLDQPEDALPNWNAILASTPNNLQAREGAARCRRTMGRPLQSNR